MLKAGNGLHKLQLHMRWQGRTHALHVHFVRAATLGLNKELVTILIGKAHNLGLNRGAVAGANALNHTVKHAGKMQIITNNLMRCFVGIG